MVIKIIYLTIIRVWKLYVWQGYSTINYVIILKVIFHDNCKEILFENSKNWLLKSSTKVLKPLGNCKKIQCTLNNDKEKEFPMISYVLRHSTVLRSLMIIWHRTSIARSMLSHIDKVKQSFASRIPSSPAAH